MGEIKITVNYGLLGQCQVSKKSYQKQIDALQEKINKLDDMINNELDRAARKGGVPVSDKRFGECRRKNGERRDKL